MVIARGTPGFSGADLANLVNEAALLAARKNKRMVSMQELEDAKDKVMMGAERRSMVMTEKDKEMTAYHEGGHALVGLYEEGNDPLHKVTIIPRGRALGLTMNLPERDRLSMSLKEMNAKVAMIYGGRIAEELIYGKENVTTGAASDIQQATRLARAMVTQYGFSDKLGRLRYEDNQEEVFLGHSVAQHKNVSDATARIIDEEIRRIIEEGEARARAILTERIDELHALARGLLEYETLNADEVRKLIKGETIERPTEAAEPATGDGSDKKRKPRGSVPTSRRPRGGLEPEPST
jgi:cell division protease FtsH